MISQLELDFWYHTDVNINFKLFDKCNPGDGLSTYAMMNSMQRGKLLPVFNETCEGCTLTNIL